MNSIERARATATATARASPGTSICIKGVPPSLSKDELKELLEPLLGIILRIDQIKGSKPMSTKMYLVYLEAWSLSAKTLKLKKAIFENKKPKIDLGQQIFFVLHPNYYDMPIPITNKGRGLQKQQRRQQRMLDQFTFDEDENNSQFNETDNQFNETDNQFNENENQFNERVNQFNENENQFDENDYQFNENENQFNENEIQFNEYEKEMYNMPDLTQILKDIGQEWKEVSDELDFVNSSSSTLSLLKKSSSSSNTSSNTSPTNMLLPGSWLQHTYLLHLNNFIKLFKAHPTEFKSSVDEPIVKNITQMHSILSTRRIISPHEQIMLNDKCFACQALKKNQPPMTMHICLK